MNWGQMLVDFYVQCKTIFSFFSCWCHLACFLLTGCCVLCAIREDIRYLLLLLILLFTDADHSLIILSY